MFYIKQILTKIKYNELKNEKDKLIQVIQEKNNIYRFFNAFLEQDKNLVYVFNPKNINFLEDIYDVKLDDFKNNAEYFQIINKKKKYIINNQKNILKVAEEEFDELKNVLEKRKKKVNNFINEKGFNCEFKNNKYEERYHMEIDLIEKFNNSSDSDSSIDSDCENNIENSNILKSKNMNKNYRFNVRKYCKNLKNQKSSNSLSNKETSDQEICSNKNSNLINKLVKLKEQYNKLINEKYDLEKEKAFKKKKISEIRIKLNKIDNIFAISPKNSKFFRIIVMFPPLQNNFAYHNRFQL